MSKVIKFNIDKIQVEVYNSEARLDSLEPLTVYQGICPLSAWEGKWEVLRNLAHRKPNTRLVLVSNEDSRDEWIITGVEQARELVRHYLENESWAFGKDGNLRYTMWRMDSKELNVLKPM